MNYSEKHITGYILAGGKSSRMGTDKSFIPLNGRPLISYAIDALRGIFDNVVIVANSNDYKIFDCETISDKIKNIGPAGGIHSALDHSASDKLFIVSCDMPFITQEAISFLIRESEQSQITVPEYNKLVYPAFGVYHKNCLKMWEQNVEKGIFKLQELIGKFVLNKINVDNEPAFSKTQFANINSITDLEKVNQQTIGWK